MTADVQGAFCQGIQQAFNICTKTNLLYHNHCQKAQVDDFPVLTRLAHRGNLSICQQLLVQLKPQKW